MSLPSHEELARELANLRRERARERRNTRLVTMAAAIVGVTLAVAVWSSSEAGTLSFAKMPGDEILASDFNDIATAVNDNDTRVGVLEARELRANGAVESSTVGVYCGETTNQDGNVGGLTGAKALCQAACGSTTAHMCSGHEMSVSIQMGLTSSANRTWVNSMAGGTTEGTLTLNNCAAWTSADGNTLGGQSVTSTGSLLIDNCARSQPVACCD